MTLFVVLLKEALSLLVTSSPTIPCGISFLSNIIIPWWFGILKVVSFFLIAQFLKV